MMRRYFLAWVACVLISSPVGRAQEAHEKGTSPSLEKLPSRLNTWSAAVEFVPTTEHIFLGQSQERRFVAIGGEYDRRIHQGSGVAAYYTLEVRPVIVESDPVLVGFADPVTGRELFRLSNPQRVDIVDHSTFLLLPQNISVRPFYGRDWTYAASVSPVGVRVHFLPHRRWQPFLGASGGLHFSERDVPVDGARMFNFTFQFGCGVEWYLKRKRSLRFEFLLRHISNAFTSNTNPGVDAPTVRVAYSFGR